jgi:hypothetical protein
MLFRKMQYRESGIAELRLLARGITMMKKLKEVFPEKSSEAQDWNFRDFYDIVQTPFAIMFFGWIETTSYYGRVGEKISSESPVRNPEQ